MTMCMTCGGRQAPSRGDVPCRCGRFAKPIYDRGHRDGFDAAVCLFWQGVCEADALDFDTQAARHEHEGRTVRAYRARVGKSDEDAVIWDERTARAKARAAELRAWASGVLSRPLFEVRKTR